MCDRYTMLVQHLSLHCFIYFAMKQILTVIVCAGTSFIHCTVVENNVFWQPMHLWNIENYHPGVTDRIMLPVILSSTSLLPSSLNGLLIAHKVSL